MNLGHLYFDIVSNFVLHISYFAGLGISTLVESALQIAPFLKNKANFRKSQMNVNAFITMNYKKRTMNYEIKNKANSNPIKANSNPISPPSATIKAETNPNKPNLSRYSLWRSRIKGKKMLLRITINGRGTQDWLWQSQKRTQKNEPYAPILRLKEYRTALSRQAVVKMGNYRYNCISSLKGGKQ